MTFLQTVARDILAKYGTDSLTNIAVVFPNKRASLFLDQALFSQAGKPLWSPSYFTISDLFRNHSALMVPDQITLIFKLYNIYTSITGSNETLDHFYSWGQLMLSDFDDLDKNLVDADKLFISLEAWQSMKDFSFLTAVQRESLEQFFGKVSGQTSLQSGYNSIWRHMGEIYHAFRKALFKDGLAYEGMLYRDVVGKSPDDFNFQHYIFVGFNLLQKVEQRLFRQLKDLGKAKFYWDYDKAFMQPQQEAGRYISQYLRKFPNELDGGRASDGIDADVIYSQLSAPKDITFLSAPTEDIQARYVTGWLKERLAAARQDPVANPLQRIAVVLGDERLLQNVVHCLPEEADRVNITTGYPLAASPAYTLVSMLIDLQLRGLTHDGLHYRLKYVNRILRHPYAKYLSDDCATLSAFLDSHKTGYPSRGMLTEGFDSALALLFRTVRTTDGCLELLPWMAEILRQIGIGSRHTADDLTHESIFRMYTLINRLNDLMTVAPDAATGMAGGKQIVGTSILKKLIDQLVGSTTIPFHGEPAMGVQIMGVLETRNLDFDHVLVLSCNEGNLPKGVNDASFIPHSLRRGFEMTTVENKVAVYAYYFYSLLQRAGDVTLAYNNAADAGRQGEMSRFMLQFMVDNPHQTVRRRALTSGQEVTPVNRHAVSKCGVVASKLDSIGTLSPSALGRYLRCNLQFYYNTVCGLREPDDNDDGTIDAAQFGDIFHRTAQLIFEFLSSDSHAHEITKSDLERMVGDRRRTDLCIDQAFREILFKTGSDAFRPQYNGLQLLNRNVIRLYIGRLLRHDLSHTPVRILALEEKFYEPFHFSVNGKDRHLMLGGQIDRLDEIVENGSPTIRVIDYKTGIPLTSAPPTADEIFDPAFVDSKHTAYYLQAFLYSHIIRFGKEAGKRVNRQSLPVAPALMFIREAGKSDYDPVLRLLREDRKKERVTDIGAVADDFESGLRRLLQEIFDVSKPFLPTADETRCARCPYRDICGL